MHQREPRSPTRRLSWSDVTIIPQIVGPDREDFHWSVIASVKESPDDPVWPVNDFFFEPLKDKK